MTTLIKGAALAVAAVLLPVSAQAHPGLHPDDLASSFAHMFSSPDHLLSMAAVALWLIGAGCVAYWFAPRRKDSASL